MPASPSSFDSSNLRSPLMVPTEEKNNEAAVVVEKLSIDEMIQKYCGEFGKWQLKHFVLANLAWTFYAFHIMVMPFADRIPEWRCVNGGGCGGGRSVCELRAGEWEWVGGRGGSTVSEWGLICGDKFKVGLVQSIFFAGCMIGAGIFGHLSDSFLGRKGSLTVACALNGIFGCITAFSPNYSIYTILRLLTGFSSGGVGLCAFVLATEPIGPTKRGSAGMSTFYFFSSGIALVSLVAYIFQTWRHLYIAASIPSLLYVIIVIPFLSESPRWYLVRGRVTEATNIMASIASSNGRHLPKGVFLALDEEVSTNKKEENHDDEEELLLVEDKVAQIGSIIDVIRFPVTRTRLLVAIVLNFVGALVYYGISLNVANLETNLYMNVALNAIAEMPAFGITAVLLERFGRKPLTIGTMWFSGFFCLLGSLMKNVGIWKTIRMVCGILGIFGMAGTYNLLFIYTAELFPTVVRNAALGCTNQAAEMGAILAPIVVVLGGWLPFAVFAVAGIVGGAFAFLLPETHNQPLYDTFAGLVGASV
ncbi:Organic cation/carnitine transporter 4 [Stylosanthes scabra]|uniref:Organic cation/carnitine transporter 4 n=1 Tax=Stylosanthes scabra TaxID=79078 RepID=A0ABU6V2B7_9FABA|nr:Organic cation/carnitine transporter 4 [Stylosanthes scabra]